MRLGAKAGVLYFTLFNFLASPVVSLIAHWHEGLSDAPQFGKKLAASNCSGVGMARTCPREEQLCACSLLLHDQWGQLEAASHHGPSQT